MGVQNLKLEVEVLQFTPQFEFPSRTPVETKADNLSVLTQLASQVGQLTLTVGQLQQAVAGQAFTRVADRQQIGTEIQSPIDEIRRLNQRLDEIEARMPKAAATGKAA